MGREFLRFSSKYFFWDYFATLVAVGSGVDGAFELNSYAPIAASTAMTVATIACFVLFPESCFLNSGERYSFSVPGCLSDIEK